MTKLSHPILFPILFFSFFTNHISAVAQYKYQLNIRAVDRDSVFLRNELSLQNNFPSQFDAEQYINQLSSLLHAKGYVTSSIDSVRYDSSSAYMVLYVG